MPIPAFLQESPAALLGILTSSSNFDVDLAQRGAWQESISILKAALQEVDGYLYLEFDIPRLGSRIDAVILSGSAVIPIEFKSGEARFSRNAINQAWDYGLDLKNFHEASHEVPIFPILVAANAGTSDSAWAPPHRDGVRRPYCCSAEALPRVVREAFTLEPGRAIEGESWGRAPYRPTPTIIQAARALYARHSVEAISRHDAGAKNLAITSKRVEAIIDQARAQRTKAIVFVTGVPGAGKTLVGLNVATQRSDASSPTHAVFLSGNGPLVKVLQEALIRDELQRRLRQGESVRKGEVAQEVKPFIQNVHHFRDEGLRDLVAHPDDHVVIFDEAQRAWNREKTSDFMRRKKDRPDFNQSEPEFLISYMDRHEDWAVVVCLVGGGQEIYTGEAGIGAWLEAVREHFPHWQVFVSPRLTDSEYAAEDSIAALTSTPVSRDPDLHLAVSMRSFRSERVSDFVKTVLDVDLEGACALHSNITKTYPLVLTRNLERAKHWIRQQARGTERFGMVASSEAYRLKPHAIDIRAEINPVHWFLNDADDTRSSYYLEDAATEFQIQGLELDWICMTWDADLRFTDGSWSYHQFRGKKWLRSKKPERQRYMLNSYRVLLTRARQGMAIFVPEGDPADPTREPRFYEGTYRYLRELGIEELQ